MTVYTILPTVANLHKDEAVVVSRPADANAIVAPGVRTIAVNVAAGSTSTLDFNLRIPTSARILPTSKIYNDVLGTTTAGPTLELGFRSVAANITTTLNALTSGIALSAASASYGTNIMGTTKSNYGKKVWELLSLASDPGGFVDVVGTTKTGACASTGFVTLDLQLGFN
jgi:hypothetical protein